MVEQSRAFFYETKGTKNSSQFQISPIPFFPFLLFIQNLGRDCHYSPPGVLHRDGQCVCICVYLLFSACRQQRQPDLVAWDHMYSDIESRKHILGYNRTMTNKRERDSVCVCVCVIEK